LDGDPYDMSHEDFKQRKKVGQGLANRDLRGANDGVIDLTEVTSEKTDKEAVKEKEDAKVGIKKDFHELLLSAGLNLKTLQVEILHCQCYKGTILVDLT
jgi:hypothetical protein